MAVLIVGVNGSPRQRGNTYRLLQRALEAIQGPGVETELIQVRDVLAGLERPFCYHCSACCTGTCYRGTAVEAAYRRLSEADGILLGSPSYFGTVASPLKAFWDFGRKARQDWALADVVGGAITVAQARFGGQETTVRALHDMMLVQGMIVVGDSLAPESAGHHGAQAQEPAEKDVYGMERAAIIARRVLAVARATVDLRRYRRRTSTDHSG